MQVSPINNINLVPNYKAPFKTNAVEVPDETRPEYKNNVYYIHPSFMGANLSYVKDLEHTNLFNVYKNSNKSLFNFIKDIRTTPAQASEFMFGITKSEEHSKQFIEEITANPKMADKNTAAILKFIGGEDNFKSWYYHKHGYQRAYERYFKKELFENDNVSVGDLVKTSPNVMIDALKLKSLKTTGSQDFVIGKIPEEIGTIEDFRALAQTVRDSKLVKEFIKFRDFMEDLDAFSERYPDAKKNAINPARFAKDFLKSKISAYLKATSAEEKAALEQEVPFLKYMNKTTVQINDKKYTYSPILRPYSTKLLYSLEPEGAKNKYFVTMEMFNDTAKTCKNAVDKENSAMRSDSPFLNAVVDYYLKENGCKNVPDMKFFDYSSNAVVYPFIKGEHIHPVERTDDWGVIFEDTALKNELKPLSELGIYITDCFNENFMKDSATGRILIVDNGHAKYSNALRPGVKMIHMGFSDLYGRDFVSLDASINRAKGLM